MKKLIKHKVERSGVLIDDGPRAILYKWSMLFRCLFENCLISIVILRFGNEFLTKKVLTEPLFVDIIIMFIYYWIMAII